MATSKSHTVALSDGASLHVEVGEPSSRTVPLATFLLFSGAFCNMSMWDRVAVSLQHSGYRVLRHDVRGVGQSVPAPKAKRGSEQFTFDQYAEDAVRVLDALDIGTDAHVIVCGTAWGSRPAVVSAVLYPERFRGCIALDFSVGVSVSSEWRAAQNFGVKLALRKLEVFPDREGEPKDRPGDFQTHADPKMAAMAMHATSKAPYNTPESFTAMALSKRLPFPVHLLTGEFDPNLVASPGGSDESLEALLAAGNDAALRVLPAAGHAIALHRPVLLAKELKSSADSMLSKSRL